MSRNPVTINDIVPHPTRQEALRERSCFIGVSINNPAFQVNRLCALIEWSSSFFEDCLVVVSDYLNRHNYLLHGLTLEELATQSMEEGKAFQGRLSDFVSSRGLSNVTLKRWGDIHFEEEQVCVNKTVVRRSDFRNQLLTEADAFVTRQIRSGRIKQEMYSSALSSSLDYILEEIAVIDHLVRNEIDVSVYPGTQLTLLKQMSIGDINVPELKISNCTYVDVNILL